MIIGIEGSFRTEMGWVFPNHKDFKLVSFDEAKRLDMNNVEAFIQTNVLGVIKNNMKDQHDFMDKTGKPRIVIEQATFRKNIDFDNLTHCEDAGRAGASAKIWKGDLRTWSIEKGTHPLLVFLERLSPEALHARVEAFLHEVVVHT